MPINDAIGAGLAGYEDGYYTAIEFWARNEFMPKALLKKWLSEKQNNSVTHLFDSKIPEYLIDIFVISATKSLETTMTRLGFTFDE